MINKNEAIKNNIKVIDNSIKNELFENLKTNFPQTIIEGKADLKAISLLLGLDKKSDISGYELTWTGKGLSNALYSSPCNKELKLEEIFSNADCHASLRSARNDGNKDCHCEATAEAIQKIDCHDFATQNLAMTNSNNPKNIIIRGDNLDVLKILKSAYSEKIKMIYIDPPYNTTNENFIYPDNFRQDYKKILEEVGLIEIDENGQEVESEDLKFFKNIQGSRTHSGWLSFMLPRLKLARDLLKEDGVIFISIDDNEQANLKLLCDEIFGEDNFVNNFIWLIGKGKKDKNSRTLEQYILCYSKDKTLLDNWIDYRAIKGKLDNPDNDKRGNWFSGSISFSEERSNRNSKKYFTIKSPSGIEWSRQWMVEDKEEMEELIKDNRIYFGEAPLFDKTPRLKIFENELLEVIPDNIFNDLGTSRSAIMEVKNMFGCIIFETPKPVELIKHMLKIATKNSDIILDFFAGSGTTAQAVMELNAEDKGNREFILVQIDEEIKEDKSKSAYDFCKKELKSENPVISDITIERVKRAAQKIIQSSKDNDLNLGFKVFTLEDKPEIIIDKDKNLKLINRRNLSVIDKVVNMFLISGKTLDKKIENIFDGKLYKCEDSFYLISFNKEILKYLIKTQNEYIFIDAYGDIELEDFLNLGAGFTERMRVVY